MFFMNAVSDILFFFAVLFIFVVGLVVLAALVMFFIDRFQTGDAVRMDEIWPRPK